MNFKSYLSVSIASIAALLGATSAQAAALQGAVGINPPSPEPGGESTGVILIGTGVTVGDVIGDPTDTTPLTDLDFAPPTDGGFGPVVELNANPVTTPTGTFNDFDNFVGFTGTILDIPLETALTLSPGTPLENAIVINDPDPAFAFDLTSLGAPVYSQDATGTTISLSLEGIFRNLSDGSNDISFGVGTASVDFAGLTIEETQALLDEDGEIPDQFNPGTWSSNFIVTAAPVPEASNILGLLVIGLGGASVLARKKK